MQSNLASLVNRRRRHRSSAARLPPMSCPRAAASAKTDWSTEEKACYMTKTVTETADHLGVQLVKMPTRSVVSTGISPFYSFPPDYDPVALRAERLARVKGMMARNNLD